MASIPTEPPEKTFTEEVLPSYEQYLADPGSVWKAKCAAFFAGHLLEWVFLYYEHHDPSRLYDAANLADFRDIMFNKCLDLKTVFDFAEASKHRFLNRKPEMRTIIAATDALLVENERIVMSKVGQYYDEVLTRAIDFWRDWLGVS